MYFNGVFPEASNQNNLFENNDSDKEKSHVQEKENIIIFVFIYIILVNKIYELN